MIIKLAVQIPPSHIKEDMKNEKKALEKTANPLLMQVAKIGLPMLGPMLGDAAAGMINPAKKQLLQGSSNLVKAMM